jgi:hypothetical protein
MYVAGADSVTVTDVTAHILVPDIRVGLSH